MTLKIETNEDSERQLTITIEVDEDRVQQAMRLKAREIGRDIRIPGFRPGKASYDVIVRRIGEGTLRAEAIDDLVQPVYEEALEDQGVEPYDRASLENIEPDPLVLVFTIPLVPTVKLGSYRDKRQEIEDIEIADEAVEEVLKQAQMTHQVLEAVDRPAASGDVITISGKGTLTTAESEDEPDSEESATDETLFDEEQLQLLLDDETLFPQTPFVENIIGMAVGDDKSFSFTFPEEYELESAYSGREATFEITLLEVQDRELPVIDDELAKLEGDYETLEDFRTAIIAELTERANENAKEALIEEMTDYLIEDAEIVFPPAAVELQIDDMVEGFKEQLSRSGWQAQDYLQLQGMTEESLREDFRENAETQLSRQLALRQFILDEKLRVDAADVDSLIEARITRFDNESLQDSMREYYGSGRGFETISSEVLRDKVYERACEIFGGNAPDFEDLEAAEAQDGADEEE